MRKPKPFWTKWTVLFPTGHREYFKDEEEARWVCLQHGGCGLTPPLYRFTDPNH